MRTGRCPTVVAVTTTAATIDDRAAELLRELAGEDAQFREHQLEAVRCQSF